jgi:hypothetical protein
MKADIERRLSLILLGALPRLAGAGLVVAALWAGFVWATYTPGAQ